MASRLSPFANATARRERRNIGKRLNFTNISKANPRDVFCDSQEDISNPSGASENVSHKNDFHEDKVLYVNSDPIHCSGGTEDDIFSIYKPPPAYGPYKRRKIRKRSAGSEMGEVSEEAYSETVISPRILNVAVLKATASCLFGPFFDWIETWEMASRIKYLGTMFFLHNFEKAVMWFLMVMHATRSLLSILTKPVAGPVMELVELILPIWNICLDTVEWLVSTIWIVMGSSCSIIVEILQIIVWPFWLVFSAIRNYVSSLTCIIWVLWEILTAPFCLVLAMATLVVMVFINIYFLIRKI
ncbi:hypothetical protein COCNU_11G008360 [Cocos nucifera]|uniref:Uncharacterized protein n=1 Tax=Cocos nucifera TaxID=13894 RepID=A0A8K0N9H8_COCNU|nr:hypothetical protein COCNU_11G008360 [Cocos nucifera]